MMKHEQQTSRLEKSSTLFFWDNFWGLNFYKYLMVIIMMPGMAQIILGAPTPAEKVRVFKDGTDVYIRSCFSSERDVVIAMNKGQNEQINFSYTSLIPSSTADNEMSSKTPVVIHQCGDDSTPWFINNTFLGANHGFSYGLNLEVKGYSFSVLDTGSMWLDSANNKFYIMKVLGPANIWMLSDNLSSSEIWRFSNSISGKQLKNAVNGQVCQIISNSSVQLRPFVRIKKTQYLVDGAAPLRDKVPTLCNFLTIREESDLIAPDALLNMAKASPGKEVNFTSGKLASILSDDITYRLGPMGSCIIEYRSKANSNFLLGYMGFIQSGPLNKSVFDSYTCYVPKSLPFEKSNVKYDFRAGQNFMPPVPVSLSFNAGEKNVENPLNLPDRFIHTASKKVNDKVIYKVGYAIGYSPISGVSKLGERAKNTENALLIYTSSKSYPYAVDKKLGKITAGKEFYCAAYRQYFDPAVYPNANSVYYHRDGDSYVVYIDYQKEVARDTIKLPNYLVGKKISVIESNIDLSLPETVPAKGLTMAINKPYAYIVLKLD